jgi:hydroxymethylpyrimidine/phosphomethylpyrimidine kinase
MVFAAHGLFGLSCLTSLTVQSTVGVRASHGVDAGIVRETLDCLESDLQPVGVKLGMLATAATVRVVADYVDQVRRSREVTVVLDPVVRSSSGAELLEVAGVALLRERLLPLVDWVTPNLEELGMLMHRRVASREEMLEAATSLAEEFRGLRVLATGGHLERPDDLVVSDGEAVWLEAERVETTATHGTGCALSSALLCRLVMGDGAVDAARSAKAYVSGAMRAAVPIGKGRGPMNHLWALGKGRGSER